MASENSDTDSNGSWTIVSSRSDENEMSSPNVAVSNTDDIDCPESRNIGIESTTVPKDSEDGSSVTNKFPVASDSENINSDMDDILSYPDISSESSKSSSLESYDMYRESSPSVTSAASESSFSVIEPNGVARPSTPDILEGINEDFLDLSTVSSFQEELPSDVDFLPGKRLYVHTPNIHLNKWLNLVTLLSVAVVLGLGIGNFIGLSRQWWLERELARSQVLKLKELQNDLIICMREKLEIENELLKLNSDFTDESILPTSTKQQIKLEDVIKAEKMHLPEQQLNILQAQDIKIHQLQEENTELRNTLNCLTNQIETRWNSQFPNRSTKENWKEVPITERVKSLKDNINQMVSENEELKSAVARLRYSNPLIAVSADVNETTQNSTLLNVYNYWKESTFLLIGNKFSSFKHNLNWIKSLLDEKQDTKSFKMAVNDVLSHLSEQVNTLSDGIYNKFNVQQIQSNIRNKLVELESLGRSFLSTSCTHTIKTTKKMKEMIGTALQKLDQAIHKFQNNEKPHEVKFKKLVSKVSEIVKKLDWKWYEVKEKQLKAQNKGEKSSWKNKHTKFNKQHKNKARETDVYVSPHFKNEFNKDGSRNNDQWKDGKNGIKNIPNKLIIY